VVWSRPAFHQPVERPTRESTPTRKKFQKKLVRGGGSGLARRPADEGRFKVTIEGTNLECVRNRLNTGVRAVVRENSEEKDGVNGEIAIRIAMFRSLTITSLDTPDRTAVPPDPGMIEAESRFFATIARLYWQDADRRTECAVEQIGGVILSRPVFRPA
jgi:hypothetical protein